MKIKIFIRHCNFSSNSVGKSRHDWFSREKIWKNLKKTIDKNTEITVLFDGEPNEEHFLYHDKEGYNLVCKPGGNDGKSFLNLLEYLQTQTFDKNDIIYVLEDDYIHKPGWCKILREGFEYIGVDYITLYDHNDKYWLPMYDNLVSKIVCTPSTHWRTVPNTTNTYACLAPTLIRDMPIHLQYCDLEKGYTRDFDKFAHLEQLGKTLISPIPGYSGHCEVEYISPVVDWATVIKETT
jgi:hypothetical protein